MITTLVLSALLQSSQSVPFCYMRLGDRMVDLTEMCRPASTTAPSRADQALMDEAAKVYADRYCTAIGGGRTEDYARFLSAEKVRLDKRLRVAMTMPGWDRSIAIAVRKFCP